MTSDRNSEFLVRCRKISAIQALMFQGHYARAQQELEAWRSLEAENHEALTQFCQIQDVIDEAEQAMDRDCGDTVFINRLSKMSDAELASYGLQRI